MSLTIDAVSGAATTTMFNVNSSPLMDKQFQGTLSQTSGPGESKPQQDGAPADGGDPMVTETSEAFGVGLDAATSPWANGFLSR
jgi:hypothetical protein